MYLELIFNSSTSYRLYFNERKEKEEIVIQYLLFNSLLNSEIMITLKNLNQLFLFY